MQDQSSNSGDAEDSIASELKTPQPNAQQHYATPGSGLDKKSQPTLQQSFTLRPKDESLSNFGNSVGSSYGEGIVRPFNLNAVGSTPGNGPVRLQNNSSTPNSNSDSHAPVTHFQLDQHSSDTLMNLLRLLGDAFLLAQRYQCSEAETKLRKLPSKQKETGWVQGLIARCLFEQVKYEDAVKAYERMMKCEPYRLEGMEYFSTCLWQLKRQNDLIYLSNYCSEKARDTPQTLCVVGNCYSLQKEHEQALKFFSLAVKHDPNFAYAHNLSGHEYIANEDYEKARKCFQYALNVDSRLYNAWWGLGFIAQKQESFAEADQHFAQATEINDRLSTMWTYRGIALHNSQ